MVFLNAYCCCRDEEEVKDGLFYDVWSSSGTGSTAGTTTEDYYGDIHHDPKKAQEELHRKLNQIETCESLIVKSTQMKKKRYLERMPLSTRHLSVHNTNLILSSTPTSTTPQKKNLQHQTLSTKTTTPEKNPHPKTSEELKFCQDSVQVACDNDQFIFKEMPEFERTILIECMEKSTIPANTTIFQEGDVGQYCYLIQHGTVERSGEKGITLLYDGQWFGTLALLYDVPLQSNAKAVTDLVVWKIYQPEFHLKVAQEVISHQNDMVSILKEMRLFSNLDDDNTLIEIANTMERVTFRQGDCIIHKGVTSNVFYMIQSGKVKISDIGIGDSIHTDDILKAGDWFGVQSLMTNGPRVETAVALTSEVQVLAMDRETFETSLLLSKGGSLFEILQHEQKKRLLKTIPIFSNCKPSLSSNELDSLVSKMNELCYIKGQYMDEVGKQRSQILQIIQQGEIAVYDGFVTKERDGDGKVFNLGDGDYFGDKHLIDDPPKPSTDNVVCETNVTCWSLSRQDIVDVIGKPNSRLGASHNFVKSRRLQTQNNIGLDDLHKLDILGEGGLGQVWLVQHKTSREMYALKSIRKRKVLDQKQHKAVMREKDILSTMRNPFVLGLVDSFQDDENLYMLSPLIRGGELYSLVVNSQGGLPMRETVFYMGCVLEALSYLHKRLICYRDLKLENIMIDSDGYCVLVDMGFAKVVTTKTFTLLGTPEYLAPEVLMTQGHDRSVDYWAFGVVLHELLTGSNPFRKRGEKSKVEVFKRICKVEYDLPPTLTGGQVSIDLIQRLLVRNPASRLGNLSDGINGIRDHDFFATTLDWKKLARKEISPPWVPILKNENSVYFDHFYGASTRKDESSFARRQLTKSEQSIFREF